MEENAQKLEEAKILAEAYSASNSNGEFVLFVDENTSADAMKAWFPSAKISTLGKETDMDASDLWMIPLRSLRCVVISAPRSATELYRVIDVVSNAVEVKGIIIILSNGSSVKDRARMEAVEMWLGCHSEFEIHRPANTLVLKRAA